jgi:hypothetical protein
MRPKGAALGGTGGGGVAYGKKKKNISYFKKGLKLQNK